MTSPAHAIAGVVVGPTAREVDCTAGRYAAPAAEVCAAVQSLAGALDLCADDEGHWQIDVPHARLRGSVGVRVEGATTVVCVRLGPSAAVGGPVTLSEVACEAAVLAAPVFGVLLVLFAAGVVSTRAVFLLTFAVVTLCPLVTLVSEVRAAWRHHVVARRTREWHARFWPALAARLGPRGPYR